MFSGLMALGGPRVSGLFKIYPKPAGDTWAAAAQPLPKAGFEDPKGDLRR